MSKVAPLHIVDSVDESFEISGEFDHDNELYMVDTYIHLDEVRKLHAHLGEVLAAHDGADSPDNGEEHF